MNKDFVILILKLDYQITLSSSLFKLSIKVLLFTLKVLQGSNLLIPSSNAFLMANSFLSSMDLGLPPTFPLFLQLQVLL